MNDCLNWNSAKQKKKPFTPSDQHHCHPMSIGFSLSEEGTIPRPPSSLQIALNVFYICILLTIKISINNFANYWKYAKPMKIIISRVEQSTTIILNFPGELLPALQADVHEEQGGLLHHLHRLQVFIESGDDDSDNDNVDDVYFVKLYNFSNCVVNVLIPMLLLSLLNLAIYQVTIGLPCQLLSDFL